VIGSFVVDSSVAIAWVVRSQVNDEESLALLDSLFTGSLTVVPVLWSFEVANSLLTLMRRRVIDEGQYERACQGLASLQSTIDDEGPRLAFEKTSTLAKKYSSSVYDAVYLELALRRGLPLATRDAALNKAAKRAGVRTLLHTR
jgi:predicted nucleic acid-binding protein